MNPTDHPLNVLFLCTHNSARSLLAEACLNHLGRGRLRAFSAGSQPRGAPHPLALRALEEAGIATTGLGSKSWDAFDASDSPRMDLVITVCDNAAGETCPYWPGQPATAHWSYADPSATEGSEEERLAAFSKTLIALHQRLELLVNLPLASLDRLTLQAQVRRLAGEAR